MSLGKAAPLARLAGERTEVSLVWTEKLSLVRFALSRRWLLGGKSSERWWARHRLRVDAGVAGVRWRRRQRDSSLLLAIAQSGGRILRVCMPSAGGTYRNTTLRGTKGLIAASTLYGVA